jgi:hypothetical protein
MSIHEYPNPSYVYHRAKESLSSTQLFSHEMTPNMEVVIMGAFPLLERINHDQLHE